MAGNPKVRLDSFRISPEQLRALKKMRDSVKVEISGALDFDPGTGALQQWRVQNNGSHRDKVSIPDDCLVCFHTHPDNQWKYPSPPSGSDLVIAATRDTVQFVMGAEGIWVFAYRPKGGSNPVTDRFLLDPLETPATLDAFMTDLMISNSGDTEAYLWVAEKLGFDTRFLRYE